MKKTFYFLAAVAAVVVTTAVVSNLSLAQGFGQQERDEAYPPRQQFNPERHAAMQEAMANGDYEAWKELSGERGKLGEIITEENFPKFVEAWQLMQEGEYEEARAIHQELGLDKGWGRPRAFGPGGCHMGCQGQGFVDANNNGVCDHKENL